MHRLLVRGVPAIGHAHADRKIRLHFVHARLYLMLLDRLPHVRRPVFVEIVRILNVEHLVGVDFVLAFGRLVSNRHRVTLPFLLKRGNNLFGLSRDYIARHNHVSNRKLFDGTEQSRIVTEVHMFARGLISKISIAVSLFDPHRLLRKLFRAFQIVGIELLRIHVIIGVGVADGIGSFLALNCELVFVALIEDVAGAHRGKRKGS